MTTTNTNTDANAIDWAAIRAELAEAEWSLPTMTGKQYRAIDGGSLLGADEGTWGEFKRFQKEARAHGLDVEIGPNDDVMIVEYLDTTPRVVTHTTAPAAYDGFGTFTLADRVGADKNGNPIRRVSIVAEHYDWQTTRYLSGCHAYVGKADSLDNFVRAGVWTLD